MCFSRVFYFFSSFKQPAWKVEGGGFANVSGELNEIFFAVF